MDKVTRFRAYHLGVKGASFSLSVDNDFTLIEARLNDSNFKNVINELYLFYTLLVGMKITVIIKS